MDSSVAFVIAASVALILGLRGSVRLSRRYASVSAVLDGRERTVLGSIAVTAWIITLAAGYFVVVSARALLGFERLPWTPFVSILIAAIVLFIPVGLDYVVERVARVPWRNDG